MIKNLKLDEVVTLSTLMLEKQNEHFFIFNGFVVTKSEDKLNIYDKNGNTVLSLKIDKNSNNINFFPATSNCLIYSHDNEDKHNIILFNSQNEIKIIKNVRVSSHSGNWLEIKLKEKDKFKSLLINTDTQKYFEIKENQHIEHCQNNIFLLKEIVNGNILVSHEKYIVYDKNLNATANLQFAVIKSEYNIKNFEIKDGFMPTKNLYIIPYLDASFIRIKANEKEFTISSSTGKLFDYKQAEHILKIERFVEALSGNDVYLIRFFSDKKNILDFSILDVSGKKISKDVSLKPLVEFYLNLKSKIDREQMDNKNKTNDKKLNSEFYTFLEKNVNAFTLDGKNAIITINHLGIFDEKGNLVKPLNKWQYAIPFKDNEHVYLIEVKNTEILEALIDRMSNNDIEGLKRLNNKKFDIEVSKFNIKTKKEEHLESISSKIFLDDIENTSGMLKVILKRAMLSDFDMANIVTTIKKEFNADGLTKISFITSNAPFGRVEVKAIKTADKTYIGLPSNCRCYVIRNRIYDNSLTLLIEGNKDAEKIFKENENNLIKFANYVKNAKKQYLNIIIRNIGTYEKETSDIYVMYDLKNDKYYPVILKDTNLTVKEAIIDSNYLLILLSDKESRKKNIYLPPIRLDNFKIFTKSNTKSSVKVIDTDPQTIMKNSAKDTYNDISL